MRHEETMQNCLKLKLSECLGRSLDCSGSTKAITAVVDALSIAQMPSIISRNRLCIYICWTTYCHMYIIHFSNHIHRMKAVIKTFYYVVCES